MEQVDYKEKYEDLIKRITKMANCQPTITKLAIESLFPELKESEDERMLREIKRYIKEQGNKPTGLPNGTASVADMIAWLEKQGDKISAIEGFETEFERQVSHLIASAINREHEYNEGYVKWTANALLNFAKHELEKQGEQKPIEKIEPKFKHGDRVRNKKSGLEQTLGSCIEDVYEGAFPFRIKDQDDWELVVPNEAPERLYLSKAIYSTYLYQVPDPDDETAVEYIRKDAFIEKASEWLMSNFNMPDGFEKHLIKAIEGE